MSLKAQKKKIPLNSVTHSVRASQAVLQYGVGAMVDFQDQTLMSAAPEYWEHIDKIYDERLAKALKVNYFAIPRNMSYARFPEWYFCPKCRKFQPLYMWMGEYEKYATERMKENDPYMVKNMRCLKCRQELVVARVITVCENGHIDDFPWVEWAHKKNLSGEKPICDKPSLTFKTGASSSEGLEGLIITCANCKCKANLAGAFDPGVFADMNNKSGISDFFCKGKHPWKNTQEQCSKYPKTVQRGSSSVYFPVTASSLVIPPFANELNTKVESSKQFQTYMNMLEEIPDNERQKFILERLAGWANKISIEISIPEAKIKEILERKWLQTKETEYDNLNLKYRIEEYNALIGSSEFDIAESKDFVRESLDASLYHIPFITGISLIHKIREVTALTGFTRLTPAEWSADLERSEIFTSVKQPETKWYPAYEVRGEGIFIEFNQQQIQAWENKSHTLSKRISDLNLRYSSSFIGQNRQRRVTAKFVLLHTLSHLLIKQLSFECGYSIASLKERIYCSEISEGKEMAGIFIYTASGDSEGTLGGLVRQGRPDSFPKIFRKAIDSAKSCSNDPVCILSEGQGRESLNLAACHSCTLIPETSCEEYNTFLDRGIISGTFDNYELGFFNM